MSRLYDALKRAAEEARRGDAPAVAEEAAVPRLDAPTVVGGEIAVAAPIPETAPPEPFLQPFQKRLEADLAERAAPEEPAAIGEIETYRDQVRKRFQTRLALEKERMAGEGKHLYEGSWLTIKEMRRLRRSLIGRNLGHIFEITLLFLVLGMMSYGLHLFLVGTLLPK